MARLRDQAGGLGNDDGDVRRHSDSGKHGPGTGMNREDLVGTKAGNELARAAPCGTKFHRNDDFLSPARCPVSGLIFARRSGVAADWVQAAIGAGASEVDRRRLSAIQASRSDFR